MGMFKCSSFFPSCITLLRPLIYLCAQGYGICLASFTVFLMVLCINISGEENGEKSLGRNDPASRSPTRGVGKKSLQTVSCFNYTIYSIYNRIFLEVLIYFFRNVSDSFTVRLLGGTTTCNVDACKLN